jgi:hypothetical protein
VQRRIGDQIEKDAVQGRGELFESLPICGTSVNWLVVETLTAF